MMRFVLALVLLGFVALAGACLWQEWRYLRARRELLQDRQPLLHSAGAFHVVSFLQLAPGADLFEALRKLRSALEFGSAARMIYAGKVALNALPSTQLAERFGEEVPWDAVVLLQFPSREAFERISRGEGYGQVMAPFRRSYSHGLRRSALVNLALPLALLAMRIRQIVTRAPSHFPFEAAPGDPIGSDAARAQLAAARELGTRAILVVNLMRSGTQQQQAADRSYAGRMLGLMAEGGHGPMHLGRALDLEPGPHFDTVALVYYPGIDYFVAMARSRFYRGIAGDKQLGDTQASITVPILDRL